MQKHNYLLLTIFFLMIGVSSSGCFDPIPAEDDATPYIVNFTFSKPTSTTFSKNQYIPIEIRFDRNKGQ